MSWSNVDLSDSDFYWVYAVVESKYRSLLKNATTRVQYLYGGDTMYMLQSYFASIDRGLRMHALLYIALKTRSESSLRLIINVGQRALLVNYIDFEKEKCVRGKERSGDVFVVAN